MRKTLRLLLQEVVCIARMDVVLETVAEAKLDKVTYSWRRESFESDLESETCHLPKFSAGRRILHLSIQSNPNSILGLLFPKLLKIPHSEATEILSESAANLCGKLNCPVCWIGKGHEVETQAAYWWLHHWFLMQSLNTVLFVISELVFSADTFSATETLEEMPGIWMSDVVPYVIHTVVQNTTKMPIKRNFFSIWNKTEVILFWVGNTDLEWYASSSGFYISQ